MRFALNTFSIWQVLKSTHDPAQPAWRVKKKITDGCRPIARKRPQNQFGSLCMAPWYISFIWRNQFEVSLCPSDEWSRPDVAGENRWNTHIVCLAYLPTTVLPFMSPTPTPRPHPHPHHLPSADANKHIRPILTGTTGNSSNRCWHSLTFCLFICELLFF